MSTLNLTRLKKNLQAQIRRYNANVPADFKLSTAMTDITSITALKKRERSFKASKADAPKRMPEGAWLRPSEIKVWEKEQAKTNRLLAKQHKQKRQRIKAGYIMLGEEEQPDILVRDSHPPRYTKKPDSLRNRTEFLKGIERFKEVQKDRANRRSDGSHLKGSVLDVLSEQSPLYDAVAKWVTPEVIEALFDMGLLTREFFADSDKVYMDYKRYISKEETLLNGLLRNEEFAEHWQGDIVEDYNEWVEGILFIEEVLS